MDMRSAKARKPCRQRGYTLAELLASMAIIGILSSVAIPGMQNVIQDNRRAATTNEFVYSMQFARSESIARNQRVTMCASTNGYQCATKKNWGRGWIVFNDIDLNGAPGGTDEKILHMVELEDNISITPQSFNASLTYRPNGRVMGDDATVQSGEFGFCDSRGSHSARVLIVGSSGRPRLSTKTAAGLTPNCG